MRDWAVVIVAVLCSLNAVRRPAFGMLAFVCFGLLNPHGFAWGFARTFPSAQLLAIGTIIGYVLWLEPKRLPFYFESKMLLGLWAIFAASTLVAMRFDRAWIELNHITKILFMVFLSTSIINTKERLHLLVRVIALSLGLLALSRGLFFIETRGGQILYGPDQSFLSGNNSFGLAMAMNLPILYYLAGIERRRWLKRFLWLLIPLTCLSTIGSFSRGAWLGLATGILVIILQSRYKTMLLTLVAAIVFLSIPFASDRMVARWDDLMMGTEEGSAQSRIWNWRFATNVALAHPVLGAGFDYYGLDVYEKYFPEFLDRFPGKVWSCHSIWFTLLSEHGIFGFSLWALLFFGVFWSLRRLKGAAERREDLAWMRPYCLMLRASLTAYLVVGTFFDAAYFDLVYHLIAVVVILKALAHRQLAAAVEAASPAAEEAPAGMPAPAAIS
jgi:probable O-glycosylation ligase (exosortase A-associated)